MREILRSIFDRQLWLMFAFFLLIALVKAVLLQAGVAVDDWPRWTLIAEWVTAYVLAALVWWCVDRWQGKGIP